MDLNFEDLEMQKWNIQTDRAQKALEKNVVICLVIIFIPRFTIMNDSKKLNIVWEKYLSAPGRSCLVFSENSMVSSLWSYHLWDIKSRNIKNTAESIKKTPQILVFLKIDILLMVAQNSIGHRLSKRTK